MIMQVVVNDGIRIHYEVKGAGPPLVLHHGMSENIARWRLSGFVEALRKQYQLILIDARGHGASDKPHDPAAYSLESRAMDVITVLDELGIYQTHYFGHSLGGWVGFGLAKYAPMRLSSLVIGGAQPYGQSLEPLRQLLAQGIDAWIATIEQMSGCYSPEERANVQQNDLRALQASVAQDRPDISEMLPAMTLPCLLFAGDEDPLHLLVKQCASEIAGARFIALAGANHFDVARHPNLMLPHLSQFLAESTATTA
jgi:pimeloyl-ACP methyl ester carboxylesterase